MGPCGWGRRGSILLLVWPSVAVGGAGLLAPWRGEGGGVGGAGGARLIRGAPGTLTVYCSQARCPLYLAWGKFGRRWS